MRLSAQKLAAWVSVYFSWCSTGFNIFGGKMIKKIFLDMDGVLVDFVGGVNKLFKLPREFPPPKSDELPQWNWFENYGLTDEQINSTCDIEFWKNLNWMYDGFNILTVVELRFHPDLIWLLTTPMPNLESASGKMMWVHNNLPVYEKKTIITRAPKHIFATPDTLLIDDKDENIDEFVKAGGLGILVPRPWNELWNWANESLEVVRNSLEAL